MKNIKYIFTILILFCFLGSCTKSDKNYAKASFEAMDTWMTIQCWGKDCENAISIAREEVTSLEKLMSTTKEDSHIKSLNQKSENTLLSDQNSVVENLPPDLLPLIDFSLQMAETTKGAFNPCLYPVTRTWGFTTGTYKIPDENLIKEKLVYTDYEKIKFDDEKIILPAGMMFDFGGIGKGYTGDKIIQILKNHGAEYGILDLGGNVQAFGTKNDGSPWKIGIKNPVDEGIIAGLSINEGAVITSGGYERFFTGDDGKKYIHIMDSFSGYPVNNGLVSVTIIAESGAYADSLSTALFVMGIEEAVNFWKNNTDQFFDFILMKQISSDSEEIKLEIIYSDSLKDKIQILETSCVEEIKIITK